MKICLICVEIFAWGKYGGFGRSTRMIGRELVKRGHEVVAVVPRRGSQKPMELLDGIKVLGYEHHNPFSSIRLYRQADADIYHSEEPSFGTFLAQYAMPNRKHMITFRDTRTFHDWWIEFRYPSKHKFQVIANILYEDNFLVAKAVRKADKLYAASKMLIPKATQKYRISNKQVSFLPSPVPFLEMIQKQETPLVCFLGRFDRRKQPSKFFELAKFFPDVHFIAIGTAQDTSWQKKILKQYNDQKNLEFSGFINQFRGDGVNNILSRSWILVNTSAREGLPTSFVEAAGHQCAILSTINADDFSSEFGYHVKDGDFVKGLRFLLRKDRWRERGMKGYRYVRNLFSIEKAMEKHLQVYQNLLD